MATSSLVEMLVPVMTRCFRKLTAPSVTGQHQPVPPNNAARIAAAWYNHDPERKRKGQLRGWAPAASLRSLHLGGSDIGFGGTPRKMSPNDPDPILRPSLYLFPTRSSILLLLNG